MLMHDINFKRPGPLKISSRKSRRTKEEQTISKASREPILILTELTRQLRHYYLFSFVFHCFSLFSFVFASSLVHHADNRLQGAEFGGRKSGAEGSASG
jgi:hypothetical protein